MASVVLVREPIPKAISEGDERLAFELETMLGYSGLREQLNSPKPLAYVLRQLEIEPYNEESVEAYQEAKRQEIMAQTGRSMRWHRVPLYKYEGAVPPPFILNKAASIVKLLPKTLVYIEFMGPDPFLFLEHDYSPTVPRFQQFYVDHWEEEFKG